MVCPREVEDLNSNRQNSPKTSNQLKKKLDQRLLDSPVYSGLRRRSSHVDRETP